MSEAALELTDVRKRFGPRVALDGLSFRAPRQAITGLVGPNGAGKTTCFSIVSGLLTADSGRVDVLGQGAFDPARHSGLLLSLPQDSELPPHAQVASFLRYLARLQGMSRSAATGEVDRVLASLELRDRGESRVRELSHGMRRRVAVAQALLGQPKLCLLDEPTSGLDPHLVAETRELLRAQCDKRGTSIIVSSHVLSDLEAICDHVVFMEAGRAVQSGGLFELTGRARSISILLRDPPPIEALRERLSDLEPSYDQSPQGSVLQLRLASGAEVTAVNRRVLSLLLELGAGVLSLQQGESLERAYLQSRRALRHETRDASDPEPR